MKNKKPLSLLAVLTLIFSLVIPAWRLHAIREQRELRALRDLRAIRDFSRESDFLHGHAGRYALENRVPLSCHA